MQQKIYELDALTIDKIAAGEVLEGPYSCVKELVDNAVDAAADTITIEIVGGGQEKIIITDNGCGMGEEDIEMSIRRHTTSKISKIEDLEQIHSRGFRGEALSSIVAVSKVTIVSALAQEGCTVCQGSLLQIDGGSITQKKTVTAMSGTTITVEDLFYNIPARRKFLQSPAKDITSIVRGVKLLAFASPHVHFTLISDGKKLFSVDPIEGENIYIRRAQQIYPDLFEKKASILLYQSKDISIQGTIAQMEMTRNHRNLQYIAINNRPVVSHVISYAIKAAFGSLIEQGKHPVFALHLFVNQSQIDINVHPQKKEIRFADEESIRSIIYNAAVESLYKDKAPSALLSSHTSIPSYKEPGISFKSEEIFPPISENIQTPLQQTEIIHKNPTCLTVLGDVAFIMIKEQEVILFDVKEALRNILFNQKKQIESLFSSQKLLFPLVLTFSSEESERIQNTLPFFSESGFSLTPFGTNAYLVEEIPGNIQEQDVSSYILEIAQKSSLQKEKADYVSEKKAWVDTYVKYMKQIQHPISRDFSITIFSLWSEMNKTSPSSLDVSCCSYVTPEILKKIIAKELFAV